ncbi:MAG: hypothetical protein WC596_00840 [Candidatus Shapirobacteria bacterium]
MIKELFLAIVLGALLGFGATGTYFALKKPKNTTTQIIPAISPDPLISSTPSPTPSNQTSDNSHSLTITSPENETIVSNSKLSIQGSTTPLSTIIIITPVKTYQQNVNTSGDFNISVDIETGFNIIQINSIDPNDNQVNQQLVITYSTAKI